MFVVELFCLAIYHRAELFSVGLDEFLVEFLNAFGDQLKALGDWPFRSSSFSRRSMYLIMFLVSSLIQAGVPGFEGFSKYCGGLARGMVESTSAWDESFEGGLVDGPFRGVLTKSVGLGGSRWWTWSRRGRLSGR